MLKCDACGKRIKDKKDVNVLAFLGFVPKAFCNNCYASRERGFVRHAIYAPKNVPLNSLLYSIGVTVMTIMFAVISFILLIGQSNAGLGARLLIIALLLLILIWQWTLLIIAKKKVNEAE